MDTNETRVADDDTLVKARLAAIVDSSFDAIISKDLNSTILTWNAAAERLFGYTAAEAVGRSILMLIPDGLQKEEDDIIGRIRRGDRLASFETTRQRKDGSLVSVSLTVSPIRDQTGRIVGASKIARDISEAKAAERRIRFLMREVSHRVKNQFAVILSIIRETSKRAEDPRVFEKQVRDRIMALSRSHDLLVASEWAGADLGDLLREHLAPFGHADLITVSGQPLTLRPNAVQNLGMAFHELGTNSAKYGALSGGGGTVEVRWECFSTDDDAQFRLTWHEQGTVAQAEAVGSAARSGFGSVVLKRVTPLGLHGSGTIERGEGFTVWTLTAPLKWIASDRDGPLQED